MSTLKEAMAAFQEQIGAALQLVQPVPAGPIWSVDRVVLNLEVALVESPTKGTDNRPTIEVLRVRSGTSEAGSPAAPPLEGRGIHRLTIEFSLRSPMSSKDAPQGSGERSASPSVQMSAAGTTAEAPVPREESTRLLLTELLGPPGFYSSARAAVLCDALRDRTLEQASAVAAALSRPRREIEDEPVRQSRHLIRGIVQTGPLKSNDRAEQLLTTLFQWWTIPELLQSITSHWRPEENW